MISRRAFLAAVGTAISASPAWGQPRSGRVARIGWLAYVAEPDIGLTMLREGLRELGYVEGRSYTVVARHAGGDFNRLPQLVNELGAEKLDVLVTRGPSAEYTKAIRERVPVIFAYSGDPVEAGFGDSLRRPGRNMTGITFMAMELSAKRVEVLKELLPKAVRIALLSNPEHAGELSEYRVTDEAAQKLGARITRHLVRNDRELDAALPAIRASAPDAMLVFPDSLTLVRRKDIADFAGSARIPAMYGWTEFVDSGGLISYGPGIVENLKTLANFVDKVLNGTPAGSIPIEQVSKIRLLLNMSAAKSLGIGVPSSILARADKVIE